MADSVVDITIRATNEIGATLKQVRADIKSIRDAQLSLAKTGAGDNLGRPFEAMSQAALAARRALKQVELDITNVKDANRALQQEAASEGVSGTFEDISEAANDAAAGVEGLGKTTRDNLDGMGSAASEAADGVGGLGQEVESLSTKMPTLMRYLRLAAGGFLAFKSVQTAKSFADTAARAEVLGTVLLATARNAGIGTSAINEMEEGVRALGITTSAARQSLTTLIQAGLVTEETAFRATELARTAQNLAVSAGTNSSETFRRLIVNIQQMDTVGLRYQGLVIDRAAAEKDLQRQIGATNRELTKQERQQAVYNAVIIEGAKLQGLYEESMFNVGKQLGSLDRLQETVGENLGNLLLPAYSALVEVFSDFLKSVIETTGGLDDTGSAAQNFANIVRVAAEAVFGFVELLIEWRTVLLSLAAIFVAGKIVGGVLALVNGVLAFNVAATASAVVSAAMTAALYLMSTAMKVYTASAAGATIATKAFSFSLKSIPLLGIVIAGIGLLQSAFLDGGDDEPTVVSQVDQYIAAVDKLKDSASSVEEAIRLGKELNDAIIEGRDKMATLREDLSNAQNNVAEFNTAENRRVADRIADEISDLQDAEKKIVEARNELAIGFDKAVGEAISADFSDRVADTNKQLNAFKEAQLALRQAQTDISKGFSETNRDVSASFEALADTVSNVADAATSPKFGEVNGEVQLLETNVLSLVAGFKNLSKSAKSPAELAQTWKLLTDEVVALDPELKKIREEVTRRYGATVIKELGEDFSILIGKIGEYQSATALLRGVSRNQASDQTALTNTLLKFGASLGDAKAGVATLASGFTDLTAGARALREAGLVEIIGQFKELSRVYQEDAQVLQQVTDAKLASIDKQANATAAQLQKERAAAQQVYNDRNALIDAEIQKATDKEAAHAEALISRARAEEAYNSELQRIRAAHTFNEKAALEAEKRLLEDYDTQKLAINKQYYDELRGLRAQSLQDYEKSLLNIASLEDKFNQIGRDRDEYFDNKRRAQLTSEELYQDNLKQIRKLASQEELARLSGDFQEAERINAKRLALAKDVDSYEDDSKLYDFQKQGVKEVEDAYKSKQTTVKLQQEEERSTAEKQRAVYETLTEQIQAAEKAITQIADKQATASIDFVAEQDPASFGALEAELTSIQAPKVIPLKPILDKAALAQFSADLKNGLSASQFAVTVTANATKEFASGGMVYGPGTDTSDSITANLSNNEFVVQAKAVKHWGSDFMYAINNMQLPGFSLGGLVRSMTPSFTPVYQTAFAGGGLVTPPKENQQQRAMDLVEIKLNMGDKKSTLMGERRELQSFVDMINAVDGAR